MMTEHSQLIDPAPKPDVKPTWRDQYLDIQPVRTILRASSGELARELQARGWNVDSRIRRAPGMTGTLKGLSSHPMARVLEQRCGQCVEKPEGAR